MSKLEVRQKSESNIRPKVKLVNFRDFVDKFAENDKKLDFNLIDTKILKKSTIIKLTIKSQSKSRESEIINSWNASNKIPN